MTILVARTDRLGDVLLITPALRRLRASLPAARIVALVRSYAAPLLESSPSVDEVVRVDAGSLAALAATLRLWEAAASVHCFVEPRGVIAAALAGVPLRLGPASKVWSALLTHRIRQRRSRSEKHEAEYNCDLVDELVTTLGGRPHAEPPAMELGIPAEMRAWADGWWTTAGLGTGPVVAIHPGGGGGAPRWPVEQFAEVARGLARRGVRMVVTGLEREATAAVAEAAGSSAARLPAPGEPAPPLMGLAAVLQRCVAFVGNSTGPLHLAAAGGTPVVGLYPSDRVMSARRWGPFGAPRRGRHASLSPLDRVSPSQVLAALEPLS